MVGIGPRHAADLADMVMMEPSDTAGIGKFANLILQNGIAHS
jgi:hypothetical protein